MGAAVGWQSHGRYGNNTHQCYRHASAEVVVGDGERSGMRRAQRLAGSGWKLPIVSRRVDTKNVVRALVGSRVRLPELLIGVSFALGSAAVLCALAAFPLQDPIGIAVVAVLAALFQRFSVHLHFDGRLS